MDPIEDTVSHLDTLISESFGEGSNLSQSKPDASLDSAPSDNPPAPETPASASEAPSEPSQPSDLPSEGGAEPDSDLDSRFPDLPETSTTPQARGRWGELKAEAKTAKAEAKALKERLQALESELASKPSAAPEAATSEMLVRLQEQLAAKERELAAYRVESTDAYTQHVRVPLARLAQEAEAIGGEDLLKALSVADPRERSRAISEAVEELPELDRLTAYNLVRELDQVFAQQKQLRENADAALLEIEQARAAAEAQHRAQYAAETRKAGEEAWETFAKKLPFLRDETGAVKPEFSAIRDEGLRTDLIEKTPLVRSYSVFAGLLLPKVLEQLRGAQGQIANLQEVLSAFEKSTPGGAKGPGGLDSAAPEEAPGDFGDFLDSAFATGTVKFG